MGAIDPLSGIFEGLSASRDLGNRVAHLEGRWRPTQAVRADLGALCRGTDFTHLCSLGKFWADKPSHQVLSMLMRRMQHLLASLAVAEAPCTFVLGGSNRQLRVYLGAAPGDLIGPLLTSHFPGISLDRSSFESFLPQLDRLAHCHVLTGVPTPPAETKAKTPPDEQVDQLVRGLLPICQWALVVVAHPMLWEHNEMLVDRWGQHIEHARLEFQQPNTPQALNRTAQHYLELLERQFKRALIGRTQGNWLVQAYLLSDLAQAASLAAGIFSSPGAGPEPLRAIPCGQDGSQRLVDQTTWMNSQDLSRLVQLPLSEYPGYPLQHVARFDVALPEGAPDQGVKLGWVQDINRPTGQAFIIGVHALVGHTLIAGTTNSGKTNTCFHLLAELARNDVPFLVIEPTKGEYRFLRAAFPKLQVLTMGSSEAPVQINPFYVQPGVPIQAHLDFLLSLFAASFVLYAPMPYVLEAALHEVYLDKGWDLAANICRRDPAPGERAFPTLSDLYDKIRVVTDRLGYEERISMDVKAALQARINSLRIGGKGAMLDTRAPFDLASLLKGQCVVEMASIGDDEQKAFLIGLLLMRLYEHYLAKGVQVGDVRLRHITVIEEAHRLLQNVSQAQSGDFANPRGKAVETFSNVITEIRGYGEGFVIVEQSPVKLTPDVLKNTNLKIVHRIISADDRQVLASVMNLDKSGQEALVSLRRGRAILFAAGMDRPMLVRLVESKERLTGEGRTTTSRLSSPARAVPTAPPALADNPQVRREFSRWVLTSATASSRQLVSGARQRLRSALRAVAPIALRTEEMESQLLNSTLPRLADWLATRMGQFYSWLFDSEQEFAEALQALWSNPERVDGVIATLQRETVVDLRPFDGCQSCAAPCRYRLFAELSLDEPDSRGEAALLFGRYFQNPVSDELAQVEMYVRYLGEKIVAPRSPEAPGVALCIAIQLGYRLGRRGPATIQLSAELWERLGTGQMNSGLE